MTLFYFDWIDLRLVDAAGVCIEHMIYLDKFGGLLSTRQVDLAVFDINTSFREFFS